MRLSIRICPAAFPELLRLCLSLRPTQHCAASQQALAGSVFLLLSHPRAVCAQYGNMTPRAVAAARNLPLLNTPWKAMRTPCHSSDYACIGSSQRSQQHYCCGAAGKSTLLNRLTNAGVLAEDKLFATLDPTTRRVEMQGGQEVLFSDTVGAWGVVLLPEVG